MTRTRLVILIGLASLAVLGTGAAVRAAGDGSSARTPGPVRWGKLSSDLARVLRAQREDGSGLAEARARGLVVVGGRVRVVVEANASLAGARTAVLGVAGKVEASHADLVQALVTPGTLAQLSRASAVRYVRAPLRAAVGPVTAAG